MTLLRHLASGSPGRRVSCPGSAGVVRQQLTWSSHGMQTELGRSAGRVYGWLGERSSVRRARAGVFLPGFAAGRSATGAWRERSRQWRPSGRTAGF